MDQFFNYLPKKHFKFLGWALFFLTLTNNAIGQNQDQKLEFWKTGVERYLDSNTDSARIYIQEIIEYSKTIGDSLELAEGLRLLGNSYWLEGNYQMALEPYLDALRIYEDEDNMLGTALVYNNIGEIYKKQNKLNTSLEYHQKSLAAKRKIEGVQPLMSYYNIGEVFLMMGNTDSAQAYFTRVMDESPNSTNLRPVAYANEGLGKITLQAGLEKMAAQYHQKALSLRKKLNDTRGIISSYFELSRTYLNLRNNGVAAQYLDSAFQYLSKLEATDLDLIFFELKIKINEARGNYVEALNDYKHYSLLKDSLFNLEKTFQIENLNTLYEVEKTQRMNQELEYQAQMSENRFKNTLVITIAFAFGLIASSLLAIKLYRASKVKKRQQEELQQRKEDLEKTLTELEIKNEDYRAYSYSVSHDLKAPLRTISFYTDTLSEDWDTLDTKEKFRLLEGIHKNIHRMEDLIGDLLDLSMISQAELNIQELDITKAWTDCLEELESENEVKGRVTFHAQPNMFANADHKLVRILLKNLLSNAIKYSGETHDPMVEMGTAEDGAFFIRDNGVGFDMQYHSKLFKPFVRLHTESEFEGTGIGLSIARRIVKKHGGEIWADSKINHGSVFYFTLC